MKFTRIALYALLTLNIGTTMCSESNDLHIQVKTRKLTTLMNNLNHYVSSLPKVQNLLMQGSLTASGFTLTYYGAFLLQQSMEHYNKLLLRDVLQHGATPAVPFWSTVLGSSMIILGLATTLGAHSLTSYMIPKN